MHVRRVAPVFLFLVLLLAGCFQTHTVIFLNADGSGTIEETVMLASFAINMISGLDSTKAFSLADEEKLIARQDSFGQGVSFEGYETLSQDGYVGYIAVYTFTDINLIHLTDNSDALQLGDDEQEANNQNAQGMNGLGLDNVSFDFEPGVLQILVPRATEAAETDIHPDSLAAETEKIRQQMEEQGRMLRAFLGDAHLTASIVFPGAITETNASFADSNRVTLADIVFGSMLDLMEENPEFAARMQLAQTEAQRQALLADMGESPEFRFETNESVYVRFD